MSVVESRVITTNVFFLLIYPEKDQDSLDLDFGDMRMKSHDDVAFFKCETFEIV
jgi:hypothetical protein